MALFRVTGPPLSDDMAWRREAGEVRVRAADCVTGDWS